MTDYKQNLKEDDIANISGAHLEEDTGGTMDCLPFVVGLTFVMAPGVNSFQSDPYTRISRYNCDGKDARIEVVNKTLIDQKECLSVIDCGRFCLSDSECLHLRFDQGVCYMYSDAKSSLPDIRSPSSTSCSWDGKKNVSLNRLD